jgi:hypothetical protein
LSRVHTKKEYIERDESEEIVDAMFEFGAGTEEEISCIVPEKQLVGAAAPTL